MVNFQYQPGQRVKIKDTGEILIIMSGDASEEQGIVTPFYHVKRSDGTVTRIAEIDLLPA
jgi:hypothetical protein